MYGYPWCPVYRVSGLPWYYCTDLSQGRQAIVADFPSEAGKLNWDQAVDFMHWLWLNLHVPPSSDYGVGVSLSRMMFLRWVPVCRQFVRLVGKHMVPPLIRMYSNEVMDILGLPKYNWPPILVVAEDCYGNLYPREPENVDSIGR